VTAGSRLRALLVGIAAGLAGGLFGVGGGIVLVPLLVGWLRTTQHQAHGTSLAAIGATALAAIVVYGAHSNVDWIAALVVGLAGAFAARLSARAAARTSARGLMTAFAILLVVVSIRLVLGPPAAVAPALRIGPAALALDLAIGLSVGLLSGFLGVGGGLVAVPAFTLVLGMSQQMAQGTSLAVILLTAPAGAIEHARHGNLEWGLVPALAIGASAGAAASSLFVQAVPHALLARAFALFLLANAVVMAARAARAPAEKPATKRAPP
jgi:hypothetical protein